MKKGVMFGRNRLDKLYKNVRCPFCEHMFAPETIQIVGITEGQTNFVILACPNSKCRTMLEIIPQYSIGINK